jgi:phage tail-like protein
MGSNSMGTTLTGARLDLFPAFRFHVEIGSIIKAVFTECSGLEMSTEVKEYEEGGTNSFVHLFPGRTKYSNVTLKRGFIMTNELYSWYKEMEDCIRQGKKFEYKQVSIILWSPNLGFPEMRWNLDRAFPVKWVGPSLKTDDSSVAVETLELAHHGIQDTRGYTTGANNPAAGRG